MDFIKVLLLLLVLAIIYTVINYIRGNRNRSNATTWEPRENYYNPIPQNEPTPAIESKDIQYLNSYEPKYLLTLNEKEQFKRIKAWADQNNYIVFTKVRLLDLITPRKGLNDYKGALWKIQAKHVDFVICDQNIRIKGIIEIADGSHKQKDRTERDTFVNEILNNCGYKIIQTYNITENQLNTICNIRREQGNTTRPFGS